MNKKVLALITAFMTMVVLCGAPAVCFADDGSGVNKEETVYVVTDSTGAQDDVIVSEHLINSNKLKKITDKTDLTDIENVKGDETFKLDGKTLTWNAGGNDIYYQGTTKAEVPVKMDVTYRLDGKEISGADLQGKSGNVEISIKFTNTAKYNGQTVPFIVMTGLMVTDSCLTNIKVDNGKVIDDGEKQIVIGMAAPGLAPTLNLGENELGLGDSVTITAKAKKFAIKDMMTIVTNSVFEDIDTGKFGNLDYDGKIAELNNGALKLVKGTKLLYDGIDTMDSSKGDLVNGVKKLSAGASGLYTNLDQIKDLVSANAGYLNYVNGVIHPQATQLSTKASQVYGQLVEIQGESGDLQIDPIDKVDDVTDTDTIRADIEALKALRDKADEEDKATYDRIIADMEKAAGNESGIINAVNNGIDAANGQIQSKVQEVNDQADAIDEVVLGAGEVASDAQKLVIIDNVINTPGTLGPGRPSWTEISGLMNEAFFGKKEGDPTVVSGAKGLADGLEGLDAKTGELAGGITELDESSLQVSQGMQKLYSEGIKKIVDLYNNDLKGLANGLSGMLDAGKGYQSFTKLPSGMDGSVKFVYKTRICE